MSYRVRIIGVISDNFDTFYSGFAATSSSPRNVEEDTSGAHGSGETYHNSEDIFDYGGGDNDSSSEAS